ncbi:MAG: HlyD family secretion protein [Planctomycetota bacterium]|jgi:HlyD family secretion protein
MSKRKKSRTWISLLVLIVLTGASLGWARSAGYIGAAEVLEVRGATVERGPLSITVTESGNLESANSTVLSNELEGRTTILYLIEEGTMVEPGDLLCELDTSNLIDNRVQQEIKVQSAEASNIKAEQNFEIQKSQNESLIALAERELEFAKEDLVKYDDGDWPQQRQVAEEAILLANESLTLARQDLEWSEKLAEKGLLAQTQLDADRLGATSAEVRLAQSTRDLELLEEYEYPRRKKELEADLVEKGRELARARLEAAARIVDFEADLRSTKAMLDLETQELADMLGQIDLAVIVAPVAGMVVHHKERSRWGNAEPIREGTEVRERQSLIQIPSSDQMTAEVSLHEYVLEKVQAGLPCRINVDAIPGIGFDGVVKFRSVLPDQNSFWANPDLRVYRAQIAITEVHEAMRPGMSCSVEILVEELEDATYIPVQSVFLDAGSPVVFVSSNGTYERREVTVGANNGTVVVVESGVTEGEIVALSVPAGIILRPAEDSTEEADDWPIFDPSAMGSGGPGGQAGAQRGGMPGGVSGGMPAGGSGGMPAGGSGGQPGGDRTGGKPSGDQGARPSGTQGGGSRGGQGGNPGGSDQSRGGRGGRDE